jgi:hypothetical protein
MKLDSLPRTSPIQINNGSNAWTRHWQIWLSQLYRNLNTQTVKDAPIFGGVNEVGSVDKVASWNYDGTFARICITLTPSGGGTTESISGSYLLLQGSHAFGICQVDDLTLNVPIGLGTLKDNRLYLPAWVAMSNTVRITAILDAGD